MSETLGPAFSGHMDERARGQPTRHRVEYFGPADRGPVPIRALHAMLEMLAESLDER